MLLLFIIYCLNKNRSRNQKPLCDKKKKKKKKKERERKMLKTFPTNQEWYLEYLAIGRACV